MYNVYTYIIVTACGQYFMRFIVVHESMAINGQDYVTYEPKASALRN